MQVDYIRPNGKKFSRVHPVLFASDDDNVSYVVAKLMIAEPNASVIRVLRGPQVVWTACN